MHRTGTALLLALTALLTASPADAATRPAPTYYGLHYSAVAEGTWPQAKVGAIRLHDTGTAWLNVNPAPGVYDWTRLDAAVANATRHHAAIDLVLGGTPAWAAADPQLDCWVYPAGSCSAPANMDDWWVYVHAVATRYRGLISSYEPVNEPNVYIFWTGGAQQLALMARVARAAVRTVDSRALLVSPSPVLRDDWQTWMRGYRAAGGYRWADVLGVHAYPGAGQGVAGAMRLYDQVRAFRLHLPLWDTETNLETNTGRYLGDDHRQALGLWRYYRQARLHGVARVYWYDWSATSNIGVRLAASTGSQMPSEAGRAFTTVQGT